MSCNSSRRGLLAFISWKLGPCLAPSRGSHCPPVMSALSRLCEQPLEFPVLHWCSGWLRWGDARYYEPCARPIPSFPRGDSWILQRWDYAHSNFSGLFQTQYSCGPFGYGGSDPPLRMPEVQHSSSSNIFCPRRNKDLNWSLEFSAKNLKLLVIHHFKVLPKFSIPSP